MKVLHFAFLHLRSKNVEPQLGMPPLIDDELRQQLQARLEASDNEVPFSETESEDSGAEPEMPGDELSVIEVTEVNEVEPEAEPNGGSRLTLMEQEQDDEIAALAVDVDEYLLEEGVGVDALKGEEAATIRPYGQPQSLEAGVSALLSPADSGYHGSLQHRHHVAPGVLPQNRLYVAGGTTDRMSADRSESCPSEKGSVNGEDGNDFEAYFRRRPITATPRNANARSRSALSDSLRGQPGARRRMRNFRGPDDSQSYSNSHSSSTVYVPQWQSHLDVPSGSSPESNLRSRAVSSGPAMSSLVKRSSTYERRPRSITPYGRDDSVRSRVFMKSDRVQGRDRQRQGRGSQREDERVENNCEENPYRYGVHGTPSGRSSQLGERMGSMRWDEEMYEEGSTF